jgi:hypothetical protein
MKVAMIVVLVLLNFGIFAYFQFLQPVPQQSFPELNPEKIKILTEQEVQARANATVETPVELAPQQ